jgi:DNA (cytosine-5)-methyltransferase 1
MKKHRGGDSINLSMPDSTTRRGRIGKGVAQTLDTQSNQAVVLPVIVAMRGRNTENPSDPVPGNPTEQRLETNTTNTTNTLTSVQKDNLVQFEGDNIRRLTEIECERLQGFPDNWTKYGIYEKQVWINKKERTFKIIEGVEEISATSRYKLCGNAVTKHIVEMIGKKLLEP